MNYIWRKKAQTKLIQVSTYCAQTFGKRIAGKFIDSIDHQVNLLAANPNLGVREPDLDTPRRQYRALLVHKHFKLIYYVDELRKTIYITTLWDVRREPNSLKDEILKR